MFRAIRRAWLLWNANAIKAEREAYERAGVIGPQYRKNSLMQELDCRLKASALGEIR